MNLLYELLSKYASVIYFRQFGDKGKIKQNRIDFKWNKTYYRFI